MGSQRVGNDQCDLARTNCFAKKSCATEQPRRLHEMTQVTTHLCTEPSSGLPHAQSRSPGPAVAPSPSCAPVTPAAEHRTASTPRPVRSRSRPLSLLCSLLYPQDFSGQLGTLCAQCGLLSSPLAHRWGNRDTNMAEPEMRPKQGS